MSVLLLEDSGVGGTLNAIFKTITTLEAVQPGNIKDSKNSVGLPGQVLVVENGAIVWSNILLDLKEKIASIDTYLKALDQAIEVVGVDYPPK